MIRKQDGWTESGQRSDLNLGCRGLSPYLHRHPFSVHRAWYAPRLG